MPGPANDKGRKKRQNRKQKAKNLLADTLLEPASTFPSTHNHYAQSPPESAFRVADAPADPTPPINAPNTTAHEREQNGGADYVPKPADEDRNATQGQKRRESEEGRDEEIDIDDAEIRLLEASASYIYDPGNGPRVRDFFAFLRSPFAAPEGLSFLDVGSDETTVALHNMGSVGEGDEERYSAAKVIPVLNKFLSGEFATILWFNRTRRTQRICPACQRLYHLGDDLQPLIPHAEGLEAPDADPETIRMEQFLSGICSIPCFALATYNYGPGAVWAYGIRMHLLDEDTRDVLESEGSGVDDQGLSVYVRMTRYDGRGLMALLGGGA